MFASLVGVRLPRTFSRGIKAIVTGGVILLGASGCNNAAEGALSGAALGALGGMGVGSIFGHMGSGAAIGAIGGAIGGAIIGDQNQRNSQRHY